MANFGFNFPCYRTNKDTDMIKILDNAVTVTFISSREVKS